MNILCLCNASTALEIIKTVKCDTYHIISPKKLAKVEMPKGHAVGTDVFLYSHRGMKKGRALKGIKWNKLIPLDEETMTGMFECQTETLKMFERVSGIKTQLYDSRKKLYLDHLRFWNHVIEKNHINCFYRSAPPHEGYDNVIYYLCKLKKIPVFLFYGFHPDMAYWARDIRDPLPDFTARFETVKATYAGTPEDQIPIMPELKAYADRHWAKLKPVQPPTVVPAKKAGTQKNLLKLHADLLKFYATKAVKPDYTKPYIYFPLHYQYEATTCPMAGVFVDQILIAEILSRIGITVYVKEHPRMSKNRSMEYYTQLLGLPNIKFVSTKEDTYKLVDNCFATATATGTAGWEAFLRGKPTLIFGYNFYQYAPGVYKVGSVKDCLAAKADIAKHFKPSRMNIYMFLKTLESYLFKHNVTDIVKALSKEVKKIVKAEA